MFDRERGEPRIGNARSASVCIDAQALENCPMPLTWLHDLAMRLLQQVLAKAKRVIEGTRLPVYARICRNANKCAQSKRRHAKARFACDHGIKPGFANGMMRSVPAKCVNKDVHVWQDHRSRRINSISSISCRPAESLRSMPGIRPPVAVLTRGIVRLTLVAEPRSSRTRRNPSSISDVNERPSTAALRLARLTNSSGRRTVVRAVICRDIFDDETICQVSLSAFY